jgi:hypothetical protein
MPLNESQITRYSRQIIVPKMGGHAQERLLSSRMVLIGTLDDIAQPLAYLVGAGVGEIDLCAPDSSDADLRALCDRMRELNPDSTVSYGSLAQTPDLVLAMIGNAAIVEFASIEAPTIGAAVIARLDAPGKIAILPSPPPCLRCASGHLLEAFGKRSEHAGFISMIATTESLKILSAYNLSASPTMVKFDGYQTAVETLEAAAADCSCRTRG